MSLGLQLILSTALVTTPPACSWAHPGANPYRGDPTHALADFDLPAATRDKLRALMRAHRFTDVAAITRDDIAGAHGYADLREMHSGRGQVCHGAVDRSAWSATRRERALVYCADDACVLVPTICNNVSLVTRKPEHAAVLDDGPIDIEPAAGPKPPPADTVASTPPDSGAMEFLSVPPIDGLAPIAPDTPGGSGSASGGGGGTSPGSGFPVGTGPIGGGGGGGGLPCCDTGPVLPVGPITTPTPPISAVPEAPAWSLLLAGLGVIAALRRRKR